MALQLRSKHRTLVNPRFIKLYSSSSSSSSSDSNGGEEKKESQSTQSISSYFKDVKASLKQSSQPPRFFPSVSKEPPYSSQKISNVEDIRKTLSEFRLTSSSPSPPPGDRSSASSTTPTSTKTVSLQDLFKRNVIEKGDGENTTTRGGFGSNKNSKVSFDQIRESIQHLRSTNNTNQTPNDRLRGSYNRGSNLRMRPDSGMGTKSNFIFGGSDTLSNSVFAKELGQKSEMESHSQKIEFVQIHNYDELGAKLRKLRPTATETKGNTNWFSLGELNERLKKLRELEEKEDSNTGGVNFKDIRESLVKLRMTNDDNTKKSMHGLSILGLRRGAQNLMLAPPKEELVEKYFHPDNMSSEEKLKLELQKVRDEFKMSESDCGSSRVQVAQLTTKIKHLSSVLHKKDKHSRKGLQAMVQRRKKLLKYLRRTDWDSYCLVLSKLGLRDNPDYKH